MNKNDLRKQAAAILGKLGGSVSSQAKTLAVRQNGLQPKVTVQPGQIWVNALMDTRLTVESFETVNGERLVILRAQDDTVRKMTRKDLRARYSRR